MNILFLDIDGVLATENTRYIYFQEESFRLLIELIVEADAYIVISSSWRIGSSLEELREIFENNGDRYFVRYGSKRHSGRSLPFDSKRIIDITPTAVNPSPGEYFNRGLEIKTWLEDHPEVNQFIIIYDETYDLKPYLSRVIKTNMKKGITQLDKKMALQLIQEKDT